MAYVTRRAPDAWAAKKAVQAAKPNRYEIYTPEGEKLTFPWHLKTKASLRKARMWLYGKHGATVRPTVPWDQLRIVDTFKEPSVEEEIQDIKRRAGIATEQLDDPQSAQWMQSERESAIGMDFTAARTALQQLNEAMRSINAARDTLNGKEREQLERAMKLIGPGVATIQKILERLT